MIAKTWRSPTQAGSFFEKGLESAQKNDIAKCMMHSDPLQFGNTAPVSEKVQIYPPTLHTHGYGLTLTHPTCVVGPHAQSDAHFLFYLPQ